MEKNNKVIIAGLVMFVIGLGLGFSAAASRSVPLAGGNSMSGMHMMPGGQMMSNGGSSMSMSDMMTSMNADLQGKTGDAFDEAFLSEMIVHHQGAVEMAEAALVNAKHQQIKDLASGIISAQKKEIGDMKTWLRDWYAK